MDELHLQQKEFRVFSRYGEEVQTHPSILEEDRLNVGNQVTSVKIRWKKCEELLDERFVKYVQ